MGMQKTMMEFLKGQMDWIESAYLSDLEACSEESLGKSPGGVARTPFDITYEVAYINRHFARRLRGEESPTFPEGWMKAPEEFQSKTKIIEELRNSFSDFRSEFDKETDETIHREIQTPKGVATPLEYAEIYVGHANYHDAQINYHQTIYGDGEVHWKM